ncbi:uncharacterized protein MYCFIDRAFT_81500 [Pseudocercospora fijiensis CIRAD86]|uniref:F-box domain-containing protein n=1 Tax=Pseudocercospora fijiensis (strain CIRAD86) TaxID=383855 RepID=M3AVE5_PSEFD|nr:uncharacterized protein MYCFIDRAFT_81500 [Pseudocercospora fijiensis CIRAD86]EME81457.1 hypothetical protein MYCFIDRAFT_81500 [Pseudocercospora fijiensis CIRAD86]
MRASMVAAALAITCTSLIEANILASFRKNSQLPFPSASACPLASSDLRNISIGAAYDWSQTAEALNVLSKCADLLSTTLELSINISIPFEPPPSPITSRLNKIKERIESGVKNSFTTHQTIKFGIRPPQKIIRQPDFLEHGKSEFLHRKDDFKVHAFNQKDLEALDSIDQHRFNFMTPFAPETSQIALQDFQASLQPTLLPIPPPPELLHTLTSLLQKATNLETLHLRLHPPSHEVPENFHQAFITSNLNLSSIKSLHLSPGMDFLVAFTPNVISITANGVWNTIQSLNLMNSTNSLEHLTLRTRWDERKLDALVQNCENLTSLDMLSPGGDGQVVKFRRGIHSDGGDTSATRSVHGLRVSKYQRGPRGRGNFTRLFEELPKLETLVVT